MDKPEIKHLKIKYHPSQNKPKVIPVVKEEDSDKKEQTKKPASE